MLLLVFVGMSIPLGISLSRIAREAVAVSQVRSLLTDRFGADARVTQLDVDFDRQAAGRPRGRHHAARRGCSGRAAMQAALEKTLGRPVRLDLDQILLEAGAGALDAQREELRQAGDTPNLEAQRMTALAADDRARHRCRAPTM